MSLASIGTLGSSLSSFYQSISGGTQPSTLTTLLPPEPPSAPKPSPDAQDAQSFGHTSDAVFSQIEAAIHGALTLAQSNTTGRPSSIIRQAVAEAFPTAGANSGASTASAAGSGPSANADSPGADSQDDPNSSASTQAYLAALNSLGVDPQKFQEDLVSAVKDAQQGNVDPSAVFSNFPLGSSLDAVA